MYMPENVQFDEEMARDKQTEQMIGRNVGSKGGIEGFLLRHNIAKTEKSARVFLFLLMVMAKITLLTQLMSRG